MGESHKHQPDIRLKEFLRRYAKKDGAIAQTMRCSHCGEGIKFVKKPGYKLWDAIIWVILLAFIFVVRIFRDTFTAHIALYVYILIAVAIVALLGLVLDIVKEWILLKHGEFTLTPDEPGGDASKS